MLQTPFTFYRGSAGVMAADLATTPTMGVHVHACGDCHLMNFGGFATPERSIAFYINDFDETAPAPWEWDVKRLVASFVLAARSNGLSAGRQAATPPWPVRVATESGMREVAELSPLEAVVRRVSVPKISSACSTIRRIEKRSTAQDRESEGSARIGSGLPQARRNGRRPGPDQGPAATHFHPERAGVEGFRETVDKALASYRNSRR